MKFSIVVPVYSEKYLTELIHSVISETYDNWELILVNDGAPDNALETIYKYAEIEKRIIPINQINQGIAAAINNGLKNSTGDYVLILGHDDCLSIDLLENVYKRALETGADIISPDVDMFFNDSDYRYQWNCKNNIDVDDIITGREAFARTFPWKIHGWNFYRGTKIRATVFPNFTEYNSDEFAYRQLMINSDKFAFCKGYYQYRFNENSITNSVTLRFFDVFVTDEKLFVLAVENNCDNNILQNILKESYLNIWGRIKLLDQLPAQYKKLAYKRTKIGFNNFANLNYRLKRDKFENWYHFFLFYYFCFNMIILSLKVKRLYKLC